MTSHREAIIFIHGFYLGRDRNFFLDSLSSGFTDVLAIPRVEEVGEEKIAGYVGKKFMVYTDVDNIKEVDVYDAYWNDLNSKQLSSSDLKSQVLSGVSMLFYWIITKDLIALKNSPPLLVGLGIALLLWVYWFYGIIALVLVALGGYEANLFGLPISQDLSIQIKDGLKQISEFGKSMTNWFAWLGMAALSSFLPINMIVDVADFSTRYLEENHEGKSLKAKIRKRVAETLNAVLESGLYDEITVLAHSFGAVIATNVLANYQQNYRVRCIIAGGSLKIFSSKSKQIEKDIKKCFNNDKIEIWIDFYSNQDWLCTKTPVHEGYDATKIIHKEIKFPFSLLNQLKGKSHDNYSINEEVLKTALNIKIAESV